MATQQRLLIGVLLVVCFREGSARISLVTPYPPDVQTVQSKTTESSRTASAEPTTLSPSSTTAGPISTDTSLATYSSPIANDHSHDVQAQQKDKDLVMGGLFPISGNAGWLGGQGCLPAALMALDDVNRSPDLLPGYRLVLHWNDSKCNPGLGATEMYDLIYNKPVKLLMLGGCSIVCSTVAETARMYNLVVVGYGSSSPALSNRERFPTFFRTHPSATIHNPTRVRLFKKFGWNRIAVLLEAEELFVETGKDLEKRCKENGIEILSRISFLADPKDAVKNLQRQDARIIVGMFYGSAARKVLCEAYKMGIYGKKYVWWLIGWYEDNWYLPVPGLNCTREEMLKVVQGHFTTEALMLNQDEQVTISGTTSQVWLKRYNSELKMDPSKGSKPEGYQEAPLAYDAIWAIALALNKTMPALARRNLTLEDFHYEHKEIMKEIKDQLMNISFLGVSGQVAFSDQGDRIAWTQIEQMVDGKYNLLGFYDTQTDNLTWNNREYWVNLKPPPDRTIVIETLRIVNRPLFMTVCAISFVGILWAIGLLYFNYHFRQQRYIQMSNPASNTFMLLGCILCLSTVVLFGLDGRYIPEQWYTLMCHTRAWILSLGFTFFFGSMFIKTWHAYRLSTQNKNKRVNDTQIYVMMSIFALMDAIVLTAWQFYDPMIRRLEYFPRENSTSITDEDMEIQPLLEICEASTVWYGVIYGYKGLMLLFGLFLSYETRSVKLKQLNDSRLVGMSIYNVVILCLITAPTSLVMNNQVNSHFAFVSLAIIFCCFLSMALIFVPKIVELVRRRPHTFTSGNGQFQETLTSKEEEDRYQKLTAESDDLKYKIQEKEQSIEEVKKTIERLSKILNQYRKEECERKKQLADQQEAAGGGGDGGEGGGGNGTNPQKPNAQQSQVTKPKDQPKGNNNNKSEHQTDGVPVKRKAVRIMEPHEEDQMLTAMAVTVVGSDEDVDGDVESDVEEDVTLPPELHPLSADGLLTTAAASSAIPASSGNGLAVTGGPGVGAVVTFDPGSDSGILSSSNRNSANRPSEPSDFEISESYL